METDTDKIEYPSIARVNAMTSILHQFNLGLIDEIPGGKDFPFYAITLWPHGSARELKLQANFESYLVRYAKRFVGEILDDKITKVENTVTESGYVEIKGWFDLEKNENFPKYISIILC